MVSDNLPHYLTPFIGREQEILDICSRLREGDCQLLTIIGPGGIGKTRLALEVANQMMVEDGIYFVPLQPLTNSDNLATAIIDALPLQLTGGEDPQQRLLDYLGKRHIMLVLDNFEHLLDRVDLVTDILATAPQSRLLVTSRERLNLQAEQMWPMRGLDVPIGAIKELKTYSAVQLFVERAQRLQPDFAFEQQHDAVVSICRLVNGLPLALELAASWTRVLSCDAIAHEIQHNIDILTTSQRDLSERHQSMRAVFDHSWQLLPEEEQLVLPRLAIFRGGFTVDAAEQIASASLHTLAALIDKSLVQAQEQGRYTLHELLRQYAEAQLDETSITELRNTHAAYYADFLAYRIEDLKGRRQLEAMAEINADFDNVRSAWDYAVGQCLSHMIDEMVDGLWLFCGLHSQMQEGFALFQNAEPVFAPQPHEAPQRLWGRLLSRTAINLTAQQRVETALQIAQDNQDAAEVAFCTVQLGRIVYVKGEVDRSDELFERAIALYRQLGDDYYVAQTLAFLMVRGSHERPWAHIKRYGEEALSLRRSIGDYAGSSGSIFVVAMSYIHVGNFVEAERLWLECIEVGKTIGNQTHVGYGLLHLSHKIYFVQGKFAQARKAAEEAQRIGSLIDDANILGLALVSLGLLQCVEESYIEGHRLCQEAREICEKIFTEITNIAAWGSAMVACGQENYVAAQDYLAVALSFLTEILGDVGIIGGLPIAAVILAHQGQPVRAVELLALAFTHPLDAAGWVKKWALIDRLRVELERSLGSTDYAAAWESGTQLDLEAGLAVLHELTRNPSSTTDDFSSQANQALIEPLSTRELEVLTLIADGLTNREIADQLYVGVSTIKKHINHVYGKLHARNRTSAIARARELDLLP